MDGPRGYCANKLDRERKTNTIWFHLYVESKKQNKLINITKQKKSHRYREQTARGKGYRGKREIGKRD